MLSHLWDVAETAQAYAKLVTLSPPSSLQQIWKLVNISYLAHRALKSLFITSKSLCSQTLPDLRLLDEVRLWSFCFIYDNYSVMDQLDACFLMLMHLPQSYTLWYLQLFILRICHVCNRETQWTERILVSLLKQPGKNSSQHNYLIEITKTYIALL